MGADGPRLTKIKAQVTHWPLVEYVHKEDSRRTHALCHLRNLRTDRSDPRHAPFIFAASALQAGDSITLMLFHDAVLLAVEGAGAKLVPVGPPNRYEEIAGNAKATLYACRPCVDARGLPATLLDRRVKLAGMNEFHAAAREADSKVLGF
jgi:sulfur relay (sulfurtransferase) complex TusBCD TusD component (DsrE family)